MVRESRFIMKRRPKPAGRPDELEKPDLLARVGPARAARLEGRRREGLGVREDHPAEQPVVGDPEAPLHLAVELLGAAPAPLDVAAPGPVLLVPADGREREVRGRAGGDAPVVEPEPQHVARHVVGEGSVGAELGLHAGARLRGAEPGGVHGEAGRPVESAVRVDGGVAAVVEGGQRPARDHALGRVEAVGQAVGVARGSRAAPAPRGPCPCPRRRSSCRAGSRAPRRARPRPCGARSRGSGPG